MHDTRAEHTKAHSSFARAWWLLVVYGISTNPRVAATVRGYAGPTLVGGF